MHTPTSNQVYVMPTANPSSGLSITTCTDEQAVFENRLSESMENFKEAYVQLLSTMYSAPDVNANDYFQRKYPFDVSFTVYKEEEQQ